MWCLETLKNINQAKGDAFEKYQAVGIKTLSNTPKEISKPEHKDKPLANILPGCYRHR